MPIEHSRRQALRFVAGAGLACGLPLRAAQAQAQVQPWPKALPTPPLQAADLTGRAWALPLAGKAVVLNFWASWCEPCRSEMPLLQQLAEFYGDRLAVLALNHKERAATAARFARTTGLTLPVLLDPEGATARAWSVKIFPTTVLIDARGQARWRVQGEWDWSGAAAGQLVEGLWA